MDQEKDIYPPATCVVLPAPGWQEPAFDRQRLARSLARRSRGLDREPGILGAATRMLVERTEEIKINPTEALDLGCQTGLMAQLLHDRWPAIPVVSLTSPGTPPTRPHPMVLRVTGSWLDLPFGRDRFSLVLSNLALHWAGNLLQALREIRRVLRPDGLLLCTVAGDDNLMELREALANLDTRRHGRPLPRVMPGYAIQQVGDALQAAGFLSPVADREQAHLTFPDLASLLAALRRMGAANPFPPVPALTRADLVELEAIYRRMFAPQGPLPLTVDVLFGHGWKRPAPT